jgi:serine phosphatase RsbU (regulator of sigma subunit)
MIGGMKRGDVPVRDAASLSPPEGTTAPGRPRRRVAMRLGRAPAWRRTARSVTFYQSLLVNLAAAILLLGGTVIALTFLGSHRAVSHLSGVVLDQTIARIELRLEQFFAPPVRRLRLLESWGAAGLLPVQDTAAMNRLLAPLLQSDPHVSAVMVADERGREHILFHSGKAWWSRQMLRDLRHDRAVVTEWSEERPVATVAWRHLDYDPRGRPWYRGAIAMRQPRTAQDANPAAPVYWTEPYVFYTLKAPGLTAALAFRAGDGVLHVAGFDVLLAEISGFTTGLRPGANGKVVVLDDDGRVIGLPSDPRFQDPGARPAFLLKPPGELGLPVVAEAVRALSARPAGAAGALRFPAEGEAWWADERSFPLGLERRLSMIVMVPESDLVGDLRYVQRGTLVLMVAGLGVAVWRAARLARRYSRPIEALARDSERISRGDLDAGPPIGSGIVEVTRLVEAHERMRVGLGTLLKLERDLQVARRIQQDTFPAELPALAGFEIGAWNEAADQTGGDTYDVIGYESAPGQRAPRLSVVDASGAVLLLADATGHGIGPALSVTEVRAMLRMAVRAGLDLPAIVEHLNAQLCADLSEGRFVSAWLGELDGPSATLRSVSCGQGPIVHYRGRDGSCAVVPTDTVPLGLLDDLAIRMREPIALGPGDVFVVASDGIVEAVDAAGAPFGSRRLIDVVVRHHQASASGLLEALRAALAAFTGSAPPEDDRTILIIKRVSPAPDPEAGRSGAIEPEPPPAVGPGR